ncbi:recombination regulator RecX [Actinobacillus succinogenes]|uniref:Regulatory protein RecX n=1 Tax=Actinobacillus succinogenes (strain ATCC 55618 / DSM 22257 / CCUG 43843 / 130Z) TaxID=339671 RepID=A6VKZ2_ACTSZ|nr:recombination regulator RecX [Actinobacillus succinogenes]ABR73639.1 regulatory protein RecX [Actinobacillus succinogenes 130Z]PHI39901.1 recombination regulator RecX [Actinobacillus succinogenes]
MDTESRPSNLQLALGYVVNLLARREYSEYEIRCKMQEKAFDEEDIEAVIAHCQQKNWQSDRRFTENYLNFRAQRGYGPVRIKQELRQLKGISSDIIEEVLLESDIDWSQIARLVLDKKFPAFREKQNPQAKQKIWRYMLSHGFHSDDFADFIGNGDSFD